MPIVFWRLSAVSCRRKQTFKLNAILLEKFGWLLLPAFGPDRNVKSLRKYKSRPSRAVSRGANGVRSPRTRCDVKYNKIFKQAKETPGVDALDLISSKEVEHVAYWSRGFIFLCGREDKRPKQIFYALEQNYFKGNLKLPSDTEKRASAGILPDFYLPLTEDVK